MTRTVATIAVRMGSERLPGKVMREMQGKPHLGHMIDRVSQTKRLDGIVVATPESPENDPIETYCRSRGISCFRGAENDVLGRLIGALDQEHADVGVEIYGDGPLIDPKVIEECLDTFLDKGPYDLVGNDMILTYPSGMFTETFSVAALKDSYKRTDDPAVREHGTLFLRQHPDIYRVLNIEAQGDLRRPDIHLDIDTEEDAQVIEEILKHFAPRNDFSLSEILQFLDAHPEIKENNRAVHRRWRQYQRA